MSKTPAVMPMSDLRRNARTNVVLVERSIDDLELGQHDLDAPCFWDE